VNTITPISYPQATPAAINVVTATANPVPVARWIDDDWQFEVAYLNQDGTPFDLFDFTAGANLFNHSNDPIELESGIGEAVVMTPASNGLVYVVYYKSGTSTEAGIVADPNFKAAGQTRLQVYIVDGAGLRTTILVQPIWVRQE
jgi:hypothetical protein